MFSTMHVIEGIFEVLDLAEHFCKKSEIDADDFVIQLSVKERAEFGDKKQQNRNFCAVFFNNDINCCFASSDQFKCGGGEKK